MQSATLSPTLVSCTDYDEYFARYLIRTSTLDAGCVTDGKTTFYRRGYIRFNIPSATWSNRVIDLSTFRLYHLTSVGISTTTLRQVTSEQSNFLAYGAVHSACAGTAIANISEGVNTYRSVAATAYTRTHQNGFCDFGITGVEERLVSHYDSWGITTNGPSLVILYYTPVPGRPKVADAELTVGAPYYGSVQAHFRRNAGSGYYVNAVDAMDGTDVFVYLYKKVNGVDSLITQGYTPGGGVLKVRAEGNSIKIWIGATLVIDTTDNTFTSTGDWFGGDNNNPVNGTFSEVTASTTYTKEFFTTSIVKSVNTKDLIIDSFVKEISIKNIELFAELLSRKSSEISISSLLVDRLEVPVETSLLVKSVNISSIGLTYNLADRKSSDINLSTLVRSTKTKTIELSANLKSILTKTYEASAIVKSISEKNIEISAILESLNEVDFVSYATIAERNFEAIDISSIVKEVLEVDFSALATVADRSSIGISTSTLVKFVSELNINSDTIVADRVSKDFNLDSLILSTKESSVSIDSILKSIEKLYVPIDAYVLSTLDKHISIDYKLLVTNSIEFNISARLKTGRSLKSVLMLKQMDLTFGPIY